MDKLLPGVDRLLKFMLERHQIYLRRFVKKLPPPWTEDKILWQYRFTNIDRELDTVTIWIRQHIREPYAKHPNLWFMLAVARQINLPATLQELMDRGAWPTERWYPRRARSIMQVRKARGDTLYTNAYMLNAHGRGPDDPSDKAFFTCYLVLSQLWNDREKGMLQVLKENSLQAAAEAFLPYHGWGPFTAAQVVADLKHTRYLNKATDWWDWMWLGPGSTRGLNRVLGRPIDSRFTKDEAIQHLKKIRDYVEAHSDLPRLCLQNTQNVLCEFDKYERTRLDEGRPKELFISGKSA